MILPTTLTLTTRFKLPLPIYTHSNTLQLHLKKKKKQTKTKCKKSSDFLNFDCKKISKLGRNSPTNLCQKAHDLVYKQ